MFRDLSHWDEAGGGKEGEDIKQNLLWKTANVGLGLASTLTQAVTFS